jgi:formylglycine-generating enzyme required for sulfatase activity
MKIIDIYIQKSISISQKRAHHARPGLAMLVALSFTASVAITGNTAFAQARRKPTGSSAAQAKPSPSETLLRSYEFDTVTVDSRGKITNRRKGQARYYVEEINRVGLEMVEVSGGSYTMGSTNMRDEQPTHQVTVPSFYVGKYEVTQAQWRAVASLPKVSRGLKPDPSNFKGDNLPVEQVTWLDVMEFCARLYKATGKIYRLPSEAEWEYACRAGTTTEFAFGETITPEIANYNGNEPYGSAPKGMLRNRTTTVGSLGVANGFGLYDMHGNVQEWCLDLFHDNYDGAPTDGSAWNEPSTTSGANRNDRMVRGGYWSYSAALCRSAHRFHGHFEYQAHLTLGFRVVALARTDVVGSQEEPVKSSNSGALQDDDRLQHDWRIEEGANGVNYASNYPAPVPFSYNGEPEATMAVESVKISGKPPVLSELVNAEINGIRKGLQIVEYLEEDGYKPQNNIVSYIEPIDGQQVAFIKYRTVGEKGGPRAMPRSIRHAIFIKDGKLHFVHLTVLFAKHQQEVRGDQIRLVKSIIRK